MSAKPSIKAGSVGEESLALQLRALKINGWVREYVFCPGRKFRADFAWPDYRLLAEIEGGIWGGKSAHNSGAGILRDMEKLNTATMNNWAVLRFSTEQVKSGAAIAMIAKYLQGE